MTASKGVRITLTAQVAKLAVQFVGIAILARLLEPSDYGIIAIAISLIGIGEIFRDFGLSTAAIQSATLTRSQRTNLFWTNTGLGAVCTLAAAVVAPFAGWLYGRPEIVLPMIALSAGFVLNGASAQYVASLSRALKFRALGFSVAASQGVGVSAGVASAFSGAGYWALVVQQLAIAASLLVFTVALGRWLPGWPDRNASVRPFIRFGAATVGSQTMAYLAKNVDVAALGMVTSPASVGYYSRAQQLVLVPLDQLNTPLTRVALPILSHVNSDRERFQRYCERSQLVACYVTSTGLLVLAGLASPIISIVLGENWGPVAPVFTILAIGGVFRSMSQVTYWIYLAKGLVGEQLKLYASTQSLIVLFIALGLTWGILGVAVGSSLGYLVSWLASLWHIQRVGEVKTGPLLARGVMAIVALGVPGGMIAYTVAMLLESPWTQLLAGGCASLLYLALVALIVRPVRDDVMMIARFASRGLGG